MNEKVNTWQQSRSFDIAVRLWPEVVEMEPGRQLQSVKVIVKLLLLLPFATVGLVWLILATNYRFLFDNLDSLAILFVAMVSLLLQPFTLRIRLTEPGDELEFTSSLAPLVMWSVLFILGAEGLWALVLAAGASALWKSWRLKSYEQNPIWSPLTFFVEQVGLYELSAAIAGFLYLGLGEEFPLTGITLQEWLPALAAIIVGGLLSGVFLLPAAVQINRLAGVQNSLVNLARIYLAAVSLPLLMGPFAVIIASLETEGRRIFLLFILLGIFLVNRLAYYISKANDLSRRQAHELDLLEHLAGQIIEAPPDASTLRDDLAAALPALFPVDRVNIHLFKTEAPKAWKPFDLKYPSSARDIPEEQWQSVQETSRAFLEISDVTLPGERRTFGDALMVKIMTHDGSEPEISGGISLLRHKSVGRPRESLGTLESLAVQIGTALNRAQNHAELLAYYKTQQELAFAGRIQASFLPREVPKFDGWQLTATLISARQTSGDFYDFIPLNEEQIGILIADVSDKGTGAALFMALSRTLLRTYAMQSDLNPEEALRRTNERIRADTETDQFVTVIYGVLNTRTGLLTYSNAGHNPGYLMRAGNNNFDSLTQTGIPLGMFEGMSWKKASVQIDPGDVLLFYTDGVTEAQDSVGQEYGDNRLLAVSREAMGRSADDIQQAVIRSINSFVGEAPQFDDVTLIVLVRER